LFCILTFRHPLFKLSNLFLTKFYICTDCPFHASLDVFPVEFVSKTRLRKVGIVPQSLNVVFLNTGDVFMYRIKKNNNNLLN